MSRNLILGGSAICLALALPAHLLTAQEREPSFGETVAYIQAACSANLEFYSGGIYTWEGDAEKPRLIIEQQDNGLITLQVRQLKKCEKWDRETTDSYKRRQFGTRDLGDIRRITFHQKDWQPSNVISFECVDKGHPQSGKCIPVRNVRNNCVKNNPTYPATDTVDIRGCTKPANVVRAFERLQKMAGGRFEAKVDPFDG